MTINVRNFCYGDYTQSKADALYAVEELLDLHVSSNKPNYIPVPNNGNNFGFYELYSAVPTVFVSVKTLTPAMLVAFQNGDKWEPRRVISQLNGAVYDYAVNVVKELLVDEDTSIACYAIKIASKHRLYSMSLLPSDYRNWLRKLDTDYCPAVEDVQKCGKMLHDAIR